MGVEGVNMAQERDQSLDLLYTVMNLRVSWKTWNVFISWV